MTLVPHSPALPRLGRPGARPGRPARLAAVATSAVIALLAGTADLALAAPSTTPAPGTGNGPLLPEATAQPDLGALTTAPATAPPPATGTGGLGHLGATTLSVSIAVTLMAVALLIVAGTTLWWMLHAWWTPQSLERTKFGRTVYEPRHSFSLLVPARHEERVLGETLDTLAAIDHPDFEVVAIIGHDDPDTHAVALAAQRRHPGVVRVVVDHSVPKNKPKALNTALATCSKQIVGVFDAEDEVHPGLLRLVDGRFTETAADVVQGGVQLMNIHSSWWSMRNCLEYYFWFRSRLHFHAQRQFIPLGGNTVFTRTELLRQHDGWDAECLAEDCEIGVRLSTGGARIAVAYDPAVVTREETPGTLRSLVKQRTRWDQGFLQVLRKGEWKKLPTRSQRLLARFTLSMPFLQAFSGLLVPVAVLLALFSKVPTPIAFVSFAPLALLVLSVVVDIVGLHEFGKVFGKRIRVRDDVRLVLGVFPYQLLLAFAAVRSVWRESRGQTGWEKTEHANVHRQPGDNAIRPVVADAVLTSDRNTARVEIDA